MLVWLLDLIIPIWSLSKVPNMLQYYIVTEHEDDMNVSSQNARDTIKSRSSTYIHTPSATTYHVSKVRMNTLLPYLLPYPGKVRYVPVHTSANCNNTYLPKIRRQIRVCPALPCTEY